MKRSIAVLAACSLVIVFAAAAFAGVATGTIAAIDVEKGTLTLKNGAHFEGVASSLLKGLEAGINVKVTFKEEGGKKIVTKITTEPIGC